MFEIAYSAESGPKPNPKPVTQFSLYAMVATIPEAIAHLRGGIYRIPKAVPEDTSETKNANSAGPRLPFNADVVDAADKLLEVLAYYAEICQVDMSNLGNTWRYHADHPELAGYIRGVAKDDSRPADRLSGRLLAAMQRGEWVEPAGMHSSLHSLFARYATSWPAIHDLLIQA